MGLLFLSGEIEAEENVENREIERNEINGDSAFHRLS